jgi:hypothetical protein
VEQHRAEVSAGFHILEVDTLSFSHGTPIRKELS